MAKRKLPDWITTAECDGQFIMTDTASGKNISCLLESADVAMLELMMDFLVMNRQWKARERAQVNG